MLAKFVLALVVFAFSLGADAETVLQRLADNINVGEIKTLQYTGNGVMFALGQNATPISPLPRNYVKSFTPIIDFTNAAMRDQRVRIRGENPPRRPRFF